MPTGHAGISQRSLATLAFLGSAGVASWGGTSIVVLHTPAKAVIAADSKTTIRGARGPIGAIETCKIHTVDDAVFVTAGTVGGSGLDVEQIATESMKGGGSLLERVGRFEGHIKQPLLGHLRALHAEDPARLVRDFSEGVVLDIAFVRMEGGRPSVYVRGYRLGPVANGSPTLTVQRSDCPGADCKGPLNALILGDQDAARATAVSLLGNRDVPDDLVVPAVKIVEAQAAATPVTVGGAVTVIQVDHAGLHWIHKGHC